jgi:hypothetical protein
VHTDRGASMSDNFRAPTLTDPAATAFQNALAANQGRGSFVQ